MKGMTVIVKTIASWVKVLIFLFGIYIIIFGHLTPGGGFAGGVILASSYVLLMLAFRTGQGRYAMFTENLTDGIQRPRREREKGATELLTAYAGRLEHYCTKYPYQWFNFYDYWGDGVSR